MSAESWSGVTGVLQGMTTNQLRSRSRLALDSELWEMGQPLG